MYGKKQNLLSWKSCDTTDIWIAAGNHKKILLSEQYINIGTELCRASVVSAATPRNRVSDVFRKLKRREI
jgi:hypothetical protein